MEKIENILWVGGIFNEIDCKKYTAISPAVNYWQVNFLKSFCTHEKTKIIFIGHRPEPLFPKGEISIIREEKSAYGINGKLLSYINLPFIRSPFLKWKYYKNIKSYIRLNNLDIIFSYNFQPSILDALSKITKKTKVKWYCIVGDHPNNKNIWQFNKEKFMQVTGFIFFSYAAYNSCPFNNKIHFEGGINLKIDTYHKSGVKKIVYAGGIDKMGGIDTITKAIDFIHDKNVEFIFCGKGFSEELNKKAVLDKRIKILGLVSDHELDDICRNAYLFVNPRPTEIAETKFNFPSKLLLYLSYLKPIISTWTAGLSPEYHDLLLISEDSAKAFSKVIIDVISWEPDRYESYIKVLEDKAQNKTWKLQNERLKNWIEKSYS